MLDKILKLARENECVINDFNKVADFIIKEREAGKKDGEILNFIKQIMEEL